jgi:carbamoyl-phosphate synthase large subunit
VVISPAKTGRTCNDKWETFRFFTRAGIPTPYTWLARSVPPGETLKFPLFIKPRRGRGSVNAFHLRNARDLAFFTTYVKDAIVQQFLEGPEYTLDTLLDLNGRVISVVPRRRLWVRSGVMDKGVTEKKFELIDLAIDVATKLEAIGPINIQVRYSNGKPFVFEVNPRFSGGIPLTIAAGADFPTWICRMALGEEFAPRLGDFKDGLVMMSFEENVFREMDVTTFSSISKLIG